MVTKVGAKKKEKLNHQIFTLLITEVQKCSPDIFLEVKISIIATEVFCRSLGART